MVPRAEIIAVDENIGLADLLQMFREAQHSRLPSVRETLDDPTGLIHVKDVLGLLEGTAEGAYCLSPQATITAVAPPHPVRAAVDARAGPAAEDAGQSIPIWRW